MDDPVTLDDVAHVAGVSRATASRALNGRDGVRQDVRDRVSRIARSMGYRPNRAARQLASGRSWVIGLVVPSGELRLDPYGASLVHAVARAADGADLGLMLFLSSTEPGEKVRTNLRDGSIDGVIVSATAVGERWIEDLLSEPFPAVLVGAHPQRADVPVVETENRRSSQRAVEHLFDQGCERVAIITGRLERMDASARLAGYRDAHRARGIELDDRLLIAGDFSRASGRRAGEALAQLRPEGVFASNDEMALGAMATVTRAGLDVPGDMAFVGFDGTSAGDLEGVSLTTVVQPFAELGRAAVRDLQLLIGEGVASDLDRVFDPELLIGDSSRRVRLDQQADAG